jgi:hypothetical protein
VNWVIFVRCIFASQLQDDFSTSGVAVDEVGDLFLRLLACSVLSQFD